MKKYSVKETGVTLLEDVSEEFRDKFDEVFFGAIELIFGESDVEPDETLFDPDNFLYKYNAKNIGEGAWIKVKTEIGFNVYWAKPVRPKKDTYSLQRDLDKLSAKEKDGLYDLQDKEKKMEKIIQQYRLLQVSEEIGIEPYYVQIRVAKNKFQYLLPTQYELVSDVSLYQHVILSSGKDLGVTYRSIFRSNDNDIIHYIMSRGISKDEAVMMAKLKDIYFICNVPLMMHKVMQPC